MNKNLPYPANLFFDLVGAESSDEQLADYLIAHLHTLEATIIRFRYQKYRSYQSIADELDSNPTSVATRIHKSLRIMKKPLRPGVPLIFEIVSQDLLARNLTSVIPIDENTPFWTVTDISEIADRALPLNGINTFGQIAALTDEEIAALHGVGPKTAEVIRHFQESIPIWLSKGEYLMDTRRYIIYRKEIVERD